MSAGEAGIVLAWIFADLVCFSTDGLTWLVSDPGVEEISGASVGDVAIVLGRNYIDDSEPETRLMQTSRDGQVWMTQTLTDRMGFGEIVAVPATAVGGPGFVALGSVPDVSCGSLDDRSRPAIWKSEDGATWGRPTILPAMCGSYPSMFLASASEMIVVGEWAPGVAATWISADGTEWVRAATQRDGWQPTQMVVGGPRYVALGVDCSVPRGDDDPCPRSLATSADGVTWAQVADQPSFVNSEILLLSYRNLVVALEEIVPPRFGVPPEENNVGQAWTSPDGLTWQRSDRQADSTGDPLPPFHNAVVFRESIVAVDAFGQVWMASLEP